MTTAEDEMLTAVLAANAKAAENVRREIYKLALSDDMASLSVEWQRWRCVKLSAATIRAAVDATVELDDAGENAQLCYAVAEILVAMAAVWKMRNDAALDDALKVIARNRDAATRAMNGDLFRVCQQRLESTGRNPHSAMLKKLCSPLLAIGESKTKSVFKAIATHGSAYASHGARREALLADVAAAAADDVDDDEA
jgi:hypothetical protein